MIALAASTASEVCGFGRLVVCGVAGMVVNDLVLFGLSRLGRGVLVDWIGIHRLHFHLTSPMVLGANFLPPLRSAAYVMYGLQGATLERFLRVSLLSSLLWVGLYVLIGHNFRHRISSVMDRLDRGGHWMTAVEVLLAVGVIATIWL